MDPRDQADALLSRARERGGDVVTPDNMRSPMDASNTQQIPGSVVAEIDEETDPDSTTVLPSEVIEQHVHPLDEPTPTTPLGGQSETGSAIPNQEQPPTQHDGLIPTTTQPASRSNLQNRLEGL